MLPYDEKDIQLLSQVLPNVSAQFRMAMANLFLAAGRIAPAEARDKNPALDQNAAQLTASCYRMLRLVGNLSAASELSQPCAELHLQNEDIVAFCRAVYDRAELFFDLCGVELRFSADRTSRVVAFSASALERALLNLLSNALKFTPRGGVVTLRVASTGRFVRLSVSDTGCGIPADRLEHLFDRFLDTERMDPYPHGLGVGLALCRRIAQGHDGMLTAESAEGEGTTFTFSLPNTRRAGLQAYEERYDYAGGVDHTLMELSDALPSAAFLQKYLD